MTRIPAAEAAKNLVQILEQVELGQEIAIIADDGSAFTLIPITPAEQMEARLAQLQQLTDEELWQTARKTLPVADSTRMQELITKLQSEGLSADEQSEADVLANRHDLSMLMRSQAALLLQERGFDIKELGPQSSTRNN